MLSPDDAAALQASLEALVKNESGPPAVIVVLDDGTGSAVYTAGTSTVGTNDPPTPHDYVRVASLSKAMTAAVALSLVDEGVLRLDDTVGEWLPELPAAWHDITLLELLNHTSGVPDFTQSPEYGKEVTSSPTEALPPLDILSFAGSSTDFPAGAGYAYSNSNPFVVALMIEAAMAATYEDLLVERVFEPLDMGESYLPAADDPTVSAPTLRGYELVDEAPEDVTELLSFGGWAWASGGIVSTPADLSKFVRGYVGGALFGAALRRQQHDFLLRGNSDPKGPGTNRAGAGLFAYQTRCGLVYGHTGSIPGYTQFIAATADGTRSMVFTISTQVSDELLPKLRAVEQQALCALLAPSERL